MIIQHPIDDGRRVRSADDAPRPRRDAVMTGEVDAGPVSYTHLTLPTIYSV